MPKLALLKGNRFNAWHLQAFNLLGLDWEVVAFRAESEIQRYFQQRDSSECRFETEPIHFDHQAGPLPLRLANLVATRYRGRAPRILPFSERLRGFDLIQSWELFTDWSAEAVKARMAWDIPLCVMVWDNIPFNMERNPEVRMRKERTARTADRFIVHTERSRRMLSFEGVEEEAIVQIDPGVDTERFCPGPPVRDRYGLEDGDFVILFVGWLLPRKGIDFLVLALRELIRDPSLQKRRVRLLVVGSGPGRDRVEKLIDRIGVREACHFAGSVPYDEMPGAFRSADVFVLPSIAMPEWQEQFGMSLIEAMACGVPVVSTYSGAIPEIAGEAAVLCQPNDFVSLYEALKDLLSNPGQRQELSESGRARAEERFRLDKHAASLHAIYDDLLH